MWISYLYKQTRSWLWYVQKSPRSPRTFLEHVIFQLSHTLNHSSNPYRYCKSRPQPHYQLSNPGATLCFTISISPPLPFIPDTFQAVNHLHILYKHARIHRIYFRIDACTLFVRGRYYWHVGSGPLAIPNPWPFSKMFLFTTNLVNSTIFWE